MPVDARSLDLLSPEACPFPCASCPQPGDCDDCLDCLVWPEQVTEAPMPSWTPRARSTPLRADELVRARDDLHLGRRVGLVLRRARRHLGLSQSALARRVEWSSSSVNRAEQDASPVPLARVDRLLRQVGHRLAIVEDVGRPTSAHSELSDESWGTEELLARDRRGRRFPPFAL